MIKTNKKIKILVASLLIILIIIIASILYILNNKQNDTAENNKNKNTVKENNTSTLEDNAYTEIGDMWEYQEQKDKEEGKYNDTKLEGVDDLYTYFLLKQCLNNYYTAETKQQALNMIDEEAKKELNINENNVSNLYNNFNAPEFCIDKIYKQPLDTTKTIYVIRNRLKTNSKDNSSITDSVVFIKIDEKNVDFSVYPNEYVKQKNYTKLRKNDSIKIDNLTTEITENDNNKYRTSLIDKSKKYCITELYGRLKFDVKYDVTKLYGDLNSIYKKEKFKDENSFKDYINQRYNSIVNGEINKYKVSDNSAYTDFIVITKDALYFTFNASTIMNYTVMLDDYTVIPKETAELYEKSFTNAKAKYCIKRVIKALNEKDYEFVYDKLDVIQKNNVYRNINELIDFVNKNFYEKSDFEVNEEYLKVSEDTYQYDTKITDATESDFSYRKLVITVTVKEGTDFTICIND